MWKVEVVYIGSYKSYASREDSFEGYLNLVEARGPLLFLHPDQI